MEMDRKAKCRPARLHKARGHEHDQVGGSAATKQIITWVNLRQGVRPTVGITSVSMWTFRLVPIQSSKTPTDLSRRQFGPTSHL